MMMLIDAAASESCCVSASGSVAAKAAVHRLHSMAASKDTKRMPDALTPPSAAGTR